MSISRAILSKFLEKYIQKIDKSQLSGSLLIGHIKLLNISFTPNVLTSFGIPLLIKNSLAEQIEVDFPLTASKNNHALLKVINADIYTTIEWDALNKIPINSIADLVQLIENEKKTLKADRKKEWNSWIEKVIDNAKIEIQNVRLHIEFTNWNKKTSSITISFESLTMNTVNSNGQVIILTEKPEVLTKRIKLTSFSIAINTKAKPLQKLKDLDQIEYNFLENSSFTFTMIHKRKKMDVSNEFSMIFDPISFKLTQDQYFALNHLFNDYSKSKIRSKFQSCMKPLKDDLNEISMWQYLHRCAKKIRHPHNFSPSIATRFLKLKNQFAIKFKETTKSNLFIKNSIRQYGEDLTYLLIQYASILIRREERILQYSGDNSISKDDLFFFSKNSVYFTLRIQNIKFELDSFLQLSINNISCIYQNESNGFVFNVDVRNCYIDDLKSNYKVIQTNDDSCNFINFCFKSLNNEALFSISMIKFDIRSSFLKGFCDFFVNSQKPIANAGPIKNDDIQEDENNDVAVKNSSLSQYLLKINPKTFVKFKLYIQGISFGYKIDDEDENIVDYKPHSFDFQVNQIDIQNFSEESKVNVISVISNMKFCQIKVDDLIISEEFSLKTSTIGFIDKYYFLDNITTKIDVLNAKICANNQIIDKTCAILSSVRNSTQSKSTKVYSSHKIIANCSSFSLMIDTGFDNLILSVSEVCLQPSIELRNVCLSEQGKEPQIVIPTLYLNDWPNLNTDLINGKLNSYEFFDLVDEIDWFLDKLNKVLNSIKPKNEDNDKKKKDESDDFKVTAKMVDYQMGDSTNSIKLENAVIFINECFNLKVESISVFDSNGNEFAYGNDGIKLSVKTLNNLITTTVTFPNIKINFLWNETNQIIKYFIDSRDLIEKNRRLKALNKNTSPENKKAYQVCVFIEKSFINIENSFAITLDYLKFNYLISNESVLSLLLNKIDIDNLLEVNQFDFCINDFIYDISIASINANLSQEKATKISELSFIPNIWNIINEKSPHENKPTLQHDINMNINSFTFIESSTKLKLTIPVIKFTLNSYHSIGAIQIPSISFEDLVFYNLELYLLYNSIDFTYKDIYSVFLLDRKKVVTENDRKLTNLIARVESIEFDYAHYFVMRIFNFYKIYSKYAFLGPKQTQTDSNNDPQLSISAIINRIIIREHNLDDPISLLGLSFNKCNDLIEFKCKSIECAKFIEMPNNKKVHEFFVCRMNALNTKLTVNPVNFYLNINTLKTLNYIYESLASLIKTEFEETFIKSGKLVPKDVENIQCKNNKGFSLDINGIQIHFPFEDDPSFKQHGLVLSFDLQVKTLENMFKSLKIKNLNMFFKNYKGQIAYLPFISDASLMLRINDNNNKNDTEINDFDYSLLEIEVGEININLTVLDIFELQQIINNLSQFLTSFFKPKIYSIPDVSRKEKKILTIDKTRIKINPIYISLCEENRSTNLYNQILTLFIETKQVAFILHKDIQSFKMDLQFTITHSNSIYGKLEILMSPTSLYLDYLKRESNTAELSISIKKDIEFNLTPSSFQTILKFIRKFKSKDIVLLSKDQSKYDYNSMYWIKNNLDDNLAINYEIKGENKELLVSSNDILSIEEFNDNKLITFTYKQNQNTFYPKNILFPTYFNDISISKTTKRNYINIIEFNSPLSIQNKLDFKIFVFIKLGNQFVLLTSLLPKCKYPLSFEENQYCIVSDFKAIQKESKHQKNQNKARNEDDIPQIDQNNLPEMFSLSLTKSPKVIKIQNIQTKKSISFNFNVSNDIQTNTRIYEIIPSIFIRNLMPYPTFYKIYNQNNVEETKEPQLLNIREKKQINFFNHDNISFYIAFSIDIYRFEKKTFVKLDKENEIFAGIDNTAIQVQKTLKTDQKEILIFKPCIIFNKAKPKIYFSPTSSSVNSQANQQVVNDFAFYGLESYTKNDNSMKIDISVENSQIKKEAIDCMRLNTNCTTIYLTRKDNPKLFYPLNCSITLGDFPMNATHVVTFTNYLYVINNLPFDFSLIPVTSNKVNLVNSNYNNIEPLLKEIESESQFLLKDCFYVVPCSNDKNKNDNCVLIDCVPKGAMFLFSVSKFPNNPIIQLSSINRTVFMLQSRKESFFVEINIFEDKSTLYAHFQIPSFPVPLVINNSLSKSISVYQNIKPNKNKLIIQPDSSSLFAFKEPFINSKELKFEISNEDESSENKKVVEFLFSLEEQLSPLICSEHNLIISTTIISKDGSKMIQVRPQNESLVFQNNFCFSLSIHSLRASLKNDFSEIALLTLKKVFAEASQDDRNTLLNLTIEKIQIDNQRTTQQNEVCLIGTGQNLLNETKNENQDDDKTQFFNLLSIFPRGIPLFSVINFMCIHIKPIYVIPESSFIFNLASFIKYIIKNSGIDNSKDGSIIIEPSFNSVNVNKTLIAYFEISPINVFIQIPTEKTNEGFLKMAAYKLLNMISLNKFAISIPKLFASEFNNNISYLFELYRNFYGNAMMNQISKNTVIRFVASSLIRFQKRKFIPLSSTSNNSNNYQSLCDNRKPIFKYFNEIELNNLAEQTEFYFSQTPDIISLLLNNDISKLEVSSFDNENQSNSNQTEERLVLGIKTDSNDLSNGYDSNKTDLIKVFQSNEIKRIRIPIISPIYSSLETQNEVVVKKKNEKDDDFNSDSDFSSQDESNSQIEVDYISTDTYSIDKLQIESQNSDSQQIVSTDSQNESKSIDQNESKSIDQNESKSIDQNETNSIDQNETNSIDQNESKSIEQNESKSIEQNESQTSNKNDSNLQDAVDQNEQDEIDSQLNIWSKSSDSQNEFKSRIRSKLKMKYLMIKRTLSQIDVNTMKNPAEIYLKIQTELLKDKKLSNQKIEFVIESKTKGTFYCVTNEEFLIFSMENDNIQITQKIPLTSFHTVSSADKVVSLNSNDKKIGQIDIEFKTDEDANTLEAFIRTQKKIITLFGHSFLI